MKEKPNNTPPDSLEHLKFEIAQECGLKQKDNQETKKNIKNS